MGYKTSTRYQHLGKGGEEVGLRGNQTATQAQQTLASLAGTSEVLSISVSSLGRTQMGLYRPTSLSHWRWVTQVRVGLEGMALCTWAVSLSLKGAHLCLPHCPLTFSGLGQWKAPTGSQRIGGTRLGCIPHASFPTGHLWQWLCFSPKSYNSCWPALLPWL